MHFEALVHTTSRQWADHIPGGTIRAKHSESTAGLVSVAVGLAGCECLKGISDLVTVAGPHLVVCMPGRRAGK